MRLTVKAAWNMRLPAVFICGPVLGLIMIEITFGLPDRLWLPAAGFLALSLVLFGVLVRGEIKRIRRSGRAG